MKKLSKQKLRQEYLESLHFACVSVGLALFDRLKKQNDDVVLTELSNLATMLKLKMQVRNIPVDKSLLPKE